MKYELVRIEWDDAWSNSAWLQPPTDTVTACKVTSIGWLVQRNKYGVFLASRIAYDGTVGNQMFIPKGMIRSIKRVPKQTLEVE